MSISEAKCFWKFIATFLKADPISCTVGSNQLRIYGDPMEIHFNAIARAGYGIFFFWSKNLKQSPVFTLYDRDGDGKDWKKEIQCASWTHASSWWEENVKEMLSMHFYLRETKENDLSEYIRTMALEDTESFSFPAVRKHGRHLDQNLYYVIANYNFQCQ